MSPISGAGRRKLQPNLAPTPKLCDVGERLGICHLMDLCIVLAQNQGDDV